MPTVASHAFRSLNLHFAIAPYFIRRDAYYVTLGGKAQAGAHEAVPEGPLVPFFVRPDFLSRTRALWSAYAHSFSWERTFARNESRNRVQLTKTRGEKKGAGNLHCSRSHRPLSLSLSRLVPSTRKAITIESEEPGRADRP